MSMNITITTYADLGQWCNAFLKDDGLKLLFLVRNPGTGKSALFKSKLRKDKHHYINAARLAGFQLYKQLSRDRIGHQPRKRSAMKVYTVALIHTGGVAMLSPGASSI
jgi:hypothetical protein